MGIYSLNILEIALILVLDRRLLNLICIPPACKSALSLNQLKNRDLMLQTLPDCGVLN